MVSTTSELGDGVDAGPSVKDFDDCGQHRLRDIQEALTALTSLGGEFPSSAIINVSDMSPAIQVQNIVDGIHTFRRLEDAGCHSCCFPFELPGIPLGCWSSCRDDRVAAVSLLTRNLTLHSCTPPPSIRLRMIFGVSLEAFEVERAGNLGQNSISPRRQ
jgi:hypothetical protein